jgi:hypothetical protein
LHRAILDHKPQILHFSGHGTDKNAILVEEASGLPRLIVLHEDPRDIVLVEATEVSTKSTAGGL